MDPIGSEVSQVVIFNSGFLTVNGDRMVDVESITITNSFDIKTYRTLNSIKKRAIRRATLEQSIRATIKGFMKEIYSKFWGSSSPISSGTEYTVTDGQQEDITVLLTCYRDDDPNKAYQFELVNPVFGSFNGDLPTEDFAGTEIDIMCTEMKLKAHTAAEN